MLESITDNIFFKLALVVVSVFCIITLLSSNAESEELRNERDELERQIAEYNELILSVENDLSAPIDEDYIIKMAREKFNMRLPEEVVFVTNITNDDE